MRFIWIVVVIAGLASPVFAQTNGNLCTLDAPFGSTDLERKVWEDICTEGTSDPSKHIDGPCPGALLSRYDSKSTRVDFVREITESGLPDFGIPRDDAQGIPWDDAQERILSEKFVTTILTDPSYVAARRTSGVTLECAMMRNLNLEEQNLEGSLRIIDSFILSGNLTNTRIDGTLNLAGAVFVQRLSAYGLEVRRNFKAPGSFFFAGLGLQDANIGGYLDLDRTTIAKHFDAQRIKVGETLFLPEAALVGANFRGAEIGGDLNIDNADFSGYINAERVRTGGAIFLRNKSKFAKVRLVGAQTGSNLETTGSSFSELFDARDAQIGGSLLMNGGATFADVSLEGAQISGDLIADTSVFGGYFYAEAIKIGRSVFLRDGAIFEEGVHLIAADIGGSLNASGSNFRGLFQADQIRTGNNIFLRDGSAFENLSLVYADIDGHLQMQGSTFNGSVNLSEALIGSFLFWRAAERFGETPERDVIWGNNATLSLRNTTAKSLQAKMGGEATPDQNASDKEPATDNWTRIDGSRLPVDLSGFRYNQLGGFSASDKNDLTQIDPDKLIHWVDNSKAGWMTGYRPQPYRALQTALQDMGAEASAKEVAYARLKHRADTRISASLLSEPLTFIGQIPAFIFDKFLQFTIGFGVYPRWAFYWFLGLVFVGYCVTRRWQPSYKDKETRIAMGGRFSRGDSLFYSLENAIPLMLPSRDHGGINHNNYYTRMYFHLQKVVGFMLASVLIGTLSFGI